MVRARLHVVARLPRPPGRSAFTLVEMLVVIAMIGVLIGLLMPVLGGVRKQARFVECSVKLRNVGKACLLHAASSKGYLPLAGRVNAEPTTNPRNYPAGLYDGERRRYAYANMPNGPLNVAVVPFAAALAPHLDAAKLPKDDWLALDEALNAKDGVWQRFMCPDTNSFEAATAGGVVRRQGTMMVCMIGDLRWYIGWATNSDYAINEGVFGYHYQGASLITRLRGNLSAVRQPAEVVLFADAIPRKTPVELGDGSKFYLGWITWTPQIYGTGRVTLGDALVNNGRAESPENFDVTRHRNRINVLFADGHVEAFAITKESLDHAYLVEP